MSLRPEEGAGTPVDEPSVDASFSSGEPPTIRAKTRCIIIPAIPAVAGIFVDGLPGALGLTGFALAAIGIWFIARPEEGGLSTRGLATAVICGVGFAGFYIFSNRAGDVSAFWTATFSRFAALMVVSIPQRT